MLGSPTPYAVEPIFLKAEKPDPKAAVTIFDTTAFVASWHCVR